MSSMPEMEPGRNKIKQFLKDNGISIAELAVSYGITRQELSQVLSGYRSRPKDNKLILKIISDLGIK
ncbi:helix-turn-helix domain-containing protein [Lactobacillus jensenii]|uniref:Helix-turn-helix domain-containing protein n=3 Tax=root TaxID=1 RepID=A0A5N1IHR9_LACJE|nr:hypothetical protein HMPREF0527_01535 [Lactobacillus jensenii SJ-7A-US]KAA9322980.1 helix-turn-helix domain-containing protein [Lactobacillus jensenii]KAA9369466.1 helix-turn-helix domain-containing protein [Lactobacillus jensenii]MBS5831797.1 helix-turn-helix domain-containing protein [Lactobacillus jensenii]PLA43694.1 transcriptional regulator [Lactobacillus jensenii]